VVYGTIMRQLERDQSHHPSQLLQLLKKHKTVSCDAPLKLNADGMSSRSRVMRSAKQLCHHLVPDVLLNNRLESNGN
jgi:hypothetical protein